MSKLILAAILTAIAIPALAATFPGAAASGCDPEKFTPVYSDDGETVLYWLNPTCPAVGSGTGYLDSLENVQG